MTQPDYRQRILTSYVSTHASVSGAVAGLERRRPFLDRLVRRHFPADRNAAVLDLGCGHGAILWAARRAGYTNLTGVDASPEQVAEARKLGILGVRHGDLKTELADTASASQDVVILFDLLHYFAPAEQMAMADEVRRVLKPGGRWILHLPNGEGWFGGRMRYWDFLATTSYTHASISQLLRAAGYTDVRCFEDTPAVHGLKSAVRWMLWQVFRAAGRLMLAAETGESGRDAIFSQVFLVVATK